MWFKDTRDAASESEIWKHNKSKLSIQSEVFKGSQCFQRTLKSLGIFRQRI